MLGGTAPRGEKRKGYTIVEVMLFLAISGVMFLMASTFINGKQSKAEFRNSMNDINAQIEQVINDVANGFYPSASDFTCTADDGGGPLTLTKSANGQGSNKGCVFLGKVIQFRVLGTNDTGYNVYSVAGRQYATSQAVGTLLTKYSVAQPFFQAQPKVIYDAAKGIDATDSRTIKFGSRVTKVVKDGALVLNGIGFFIEPASYNGGTLQAGSPDIVVMPIAGPVPVDKPTMAAAIEAAVKVTKPASTPNIAICFDDGGSQKAKITIGNGSSQRLSTTLNINNGNTTC